MPQGRVVARFAADRSAIHLPRLGRYFQVGIADALDVGFDLERAVQGEHDASINRPDVPWTSVIPLSEGLNKFSLTELQHRDCIPLLCYGQSEIRCVSKFCLRLDQWFGRLPLDEGSTERRHI